METCYEYSRCDILCVCVCMCVLLITCTHPAAGVETFFLSQDQIPNQQRVGTLPMSQQVIATLTGHNSPPHSLTCSLNVSSTLVCLRMKTSIHPHKVPGDASNLGDVLMSLLTH